MPQGLLPFFPAGTTYINSLVTFEKRDQKVTYFNHSTDPLYPLYQA